MKLMEERLDPIKTIIDDMGKLKTELKTNLNKHRLLNKYENDSLEQYSRGMALYKMYLYVCMYVCIAKDIGVTINSVSDISTAHNVLANVVYSRDLLSVNLCGDAQKKL